MSVVSSAVVVYSRPTAERNEMKIKKNLFSKPITKKDQITFANNWLRNAIAPREMKIKNIKRLNYEVGWPDGGDLRRRKIDDQMVCRSSSRNSRLLFDLLTISCGFAISMKIKFHVLKLRQANLRDH